MDIVKTAKKGKHLNTLEKEHDSLYITDDTQQTIFRMQETGKRK
jgi:hypothetical protein